MESKRHDPIAEDHRLLLTAVAVDRIDQAGDVLLRQKLVDQRELDALHFRQMLGEQQTARCRLVHLGNRFTRLVRRDETALDLGVQRHGLGFERV